MLSERSHDNDCNFTCCLSITALEISITSNLPVGK